jgi:anti-sigma B factor antagonist
MPHSPPYRLEPDRNRTVVTLLPGLNEIPWADIEQIGTEILQRLQQIATPALLVDLSALNYMGSVQVALVVRMFKAVKERGGQMIVANRDPMVLEVLSLAGLNKIWTITTSREEGLRLLPGGEEDVDVTAPGGWQTAVGLICVAVSLLGLAAVLLQADWLPRPGSVWLQGGAAALGFVFGLWGVWQGIGARRTIGGGVLVGSVALLVASVFLLGQMQTAPASPEPTATTPPPEASSANAEPIAETPAATSAADPVSPTEPAPVEGEKTATP